ncbi:hypothetical protein G647_03172 [Cladophialophora carrionii CBS 160.54]|uniref:Uncharacterized protein n=1 Tax=Cladophialophora carrionii CBS 160.54 TaxID=1279043 RepID=V9DHR5_9EURO|nr:uncharacterized protein G647_03172 [Cladophialophora carrionii CBS 160.54]ETI26395.1 hypothetical protein G647_03172 [Cladophialophora carrionii CBS 160.54]
MYLRHLTSDPGSGANLQSSRPLYKLSFFVPTLRTKLWKSETMW